MTKKKGQGFTLIELLVVIAIIAVLAAVAFVALDPATRFKDSRDSARWQDVAALANAVKLEQVDNGGNYSAEISGLPADTVFMIGDGTTGCNTGCATVASSTACVDLAGIETGGYIGNMPTSPEGAGNWNASTTGYTVRRNANGSVSVAACEAENSGAIAITR